MYIGSNECNKNYRGRQTDSVSEPKKISKCCANHQASISYVDFSCSPLNYRGHG